MTTATLTPLEPVSDSGKAELLFHPLRLQILSEARTPSTAAEIARRLGHPPQKVNYHVRTLADAGFLDAAGEGVKRNLIEKRYRASAASYVLMPQVLGEMGPGAVSNADRFSATHLMQLSAQLLGEVGTWLQAGEGQEADVPTLSMDAELRFESAAQRSAFATALQDAVTDVIRTHSAPANTTGAQPKPGRPFRLVVGCYPVPPTPESET